MSNKKNRNQIPEEQTAPAAPEGPATAKDSIYAILGAAAGVLEVVLYGLAFTPVGVYVIIGGIVCGIAACGLIRTQQKRRPLAWAKVLYIMCCVVLALGVLFMIGGIIWASMQES